MNQGIQNTVTHSSKFFSISVGDTVRLTWSSLQMSPWPIKAQALPLLQGWCEAAIMRRWCFF